MAGKAELLTGIEAASGKPVRWIVLNTDPMLRPAEVRRHRATREGVGTGRPALRQADAALPLAILRH